MLLAALLDPYAAFLTLAVILFIQALFFSEGEKHLVTFATILAMKPNILLMDEPTAALDPEARRALIQLVRSLPHTRVVTTHDLDFVLECCERTIVLADGTIVYDGQTEAILTNEPFLHEHHLKLPLMLQ